MEQPYEDTPEREQAAARAHGQREAAARRAPATVRVATGSEAIPLVPLLDWVAFPEMAMPLQASRDTSLAAVAAGEESGDRVVLVAQRRPHKTVRARDLYEVGTVAKIIRKLRMPDGSAQVLLQGQHRAQIRAIDEAEGYLLAHVEPVESESEPSLELEALRRVVVAQVQAIAEETNQFPPDVVSMTRRVSDPSWLSDYICFSSDMSMHERQEVLETFDSVRRLRKIARYLTRQAQILDIKSKIQGEIQEGIEKVQRDFYLREQLKAVQRELGISNPQIDDSDELRQRVQAAGLPEAVAAKALQEINRLEGTPPTSPEIGVIRGYLDWLLGLPWTRESRDSTSLARTRRVLDRDHYGLQRVKQRMLEFLAVRMVASSFRTPILCLVGAARRRQDQPGALGGARAGSRVRAHLPGRRARRSRDPRAPAHLRGRLAGAHRAGHAALRHAQPGDASGRGGQDRARFPRRPVLGPARGSRPRAQSQLLGSLPGSSVRPIARAVHHHRQRGGADPRGAARPHGSDRALRLHRGRESSHRRGVFAGPPAEGHGLAGHGTRISKLAIREVIRHYTREAGVRNLERELAGACRKIARLVAGGGRAPRRVAPRQIRAMLGPPRYRPEDDDRSPLVGVATGLAVTPVGGEVLDVEATWVAGRGEVRLTGQLGDVMSESARAALTYVRARARRFGVNPDQFGERDLHVHVPAGNVPKDGPSAGITMSAAIVSAVSGRPVRRDVALTGEVTLRGRVLPIGGLKEKVLAAHRAGLRTVVAPSANKADLVDIPAKVRRQMRFVWVTDMDAVLASTLLERARGAGAASPRRAAPTA